MLLRIAARRALPAAARPCSWAARCRSSCARSAAPMASPTPPPAASPMTPPAASSRLGRDTALLYGVNTLGAVCGVAGAGFSPFHCSACTPASCSRRRSTSPPPWAPWRSPPGTPAGPLDRCSAGRSSTPTPAPAAAATPRPRRDRSARVLLLAAVLMGATSLAFEVLWTRILVFYLGSSVYAFSLMLLGFLARHRPRQPRHRPHGRPPGASVRPARRGRAGDRRHRSPVDLALRDAQRPPDRALRSPAPAELRRRDLRPAPRRAADPPAADPAHGSELPAAGARLLGAPRQRGERIGSDLGELYGANTLGCIAGSLGAGFVLIPLLGTQNALLAVGAVCALLGWLFARADGRDRRRIPGACAPSRSRRRRSWSRSPSSCRPIASSSPPASSARTVRATWSISTRTRARRWRSASKTDAAGPYLSLELNGVNVAGSSPDLYAVQKMQGHLPLLLGQSRGACVVHIGFGSGGTAHAVSRHPVKEIRIVEISPAVLAASDRYFGDDQPRRPRRSPRARRDQRRPQLPARHHRESSTPSSPTRSTRATPATARSTARSTSASWRSACARRRGLDVAADVHPHAGELRDDRARLPNVFPETVIWYEPSALNSFTIVTGRKRGGPWDPAALARGFADPAIREALADIRMHRTGRPPRLLPRRGCRARRLPRRHAAARRRPAGRRVRERHAPRRRLDLARHLLAPARARPPEPPAVVLAALPPAEHAAMRELWRARDAPARGSAALPGLRSHPLSMKALARAVAGRAHRARLLRRSGGAVHRPPLPVHGRTPGRLVPAVPAGDLGVRAAAVAGREPGAEAPRKAPARHVRARPRQSTCASLAALLVVLVAYTNLKCRLLLFHPQLFDRIFWQLDDTLHMGGGDFVAWVTSLHSPPRTGLMQHVYFYAWAALALPLAVAMARSGARAGAPRARRPRAVLHRRGLRLPGASRASARRSSSAAATPPSPARTSSPCSSRCSRRCATPSRTRRRPPPRSSASRPSPASTSPPARSASSSPGELAPPLLLLLVPWNLAIAASAVYFGWHYVVDFYPALLLAWGMVGGGETDHRSRSRHASGLEVVDPGEEILEPLPRAAGARSRQSRAAAGSVARRRGSRCDASPARGDNLQGTGLHRRSRRLRSASRRHRTAGTPPPRDSGTTSPGPGPGGSR